MHLSRLWLVLALCPLLSCQREAARLGFHEATGDKGTQFTAPPFEVVGFRNVTRAAGVDFAHNNGAYGKKLLPETMGAGLAFLDYDNDGDQDLFLVNGKDWSGHPRRGRSSQALYRNDGRGRFTNVTRETGLELEFYGMGVAAGDVDNDGAIDLLLTGLGPNRLYRNRGDGTFVDATEGSGLEDPSWGTSAAFLDYDRDGNLDLFVCNYVKWTPETDLWCTLDGTHKSYCTPESYEGEHSRLYRNEGEGVFRDVSEAAGILAGQGKSLGVTVLDYNEDGWADLAVANDTQPNLLFENQGDGTFREVGVETGIAFSEGGEARGAMGIDSGDYANQGVESLVVGNFSNEMLALYHNAGNVFIDKGPASALGRSSLLFLTFGLFFFDYDLDGFLDIFVANGHVENDIQKVQEQVSYRERPLLFRNAGGGRFEEVGMQSGPGLSIPVVGRGAAYADIDNDGDLDVAVSVNDGRPLLLVNEEAAGRHRIRLTAVGTSSNRSGIGARFVVEVGGMAQTRVVKSGSSYCSQSELPVTFGLGEASAADSVEVIWPNGNRESLGRLEADRSYVVEEGKQVVSSTPLPAEANL